MIHSRCHPTVSHREDIAYMVQTPPGGMHLGVSARGNMVVDDPRLCCMQRSRSTRTRSPSGTWPQSASVRQTPS